jgi:hypothetical protein
LALARLKVLNQKTEYNRVFIYFNDTIKLEIKDDYKGFETVPAKKIDNEIKDTYIICGTTYLYDILNNYADSDVLIKLSDDVMGTVKIDDVNRNIGYVLTLYKKYE